MARPIPTNIESTGEGWDAFVDANFDLCFVIPLPLGEYASIAALTSARAANAHDRCIAVVQSENRIAFSDGTTWKLIPIEGGTVASLTDNSGGTSGGDTIAVVTDIASAANAIATLAAKVNSLLATLRASNAIDT